MLKKNYNSSINPCKMLLLKVIVALSVYQHYCVGKYIYSVNYAVGLEIQDEDLEIIDDEFTADTEEKQIKDDEFSEVSYEVLITDDEFTEDSHENYIIDEDYSSDSDESQITDEEFTDDSHENYLKGDELTTKPDENPTTDDEITTKPDENPTTDDEITTKPDENPTTDDEITTKPDENPTTDSEITTKPDENPTTESGECPRHKSRISRDDIRELVDHRFTDLGLNKTLMEHIIPEAKDINRKHSEDFDQFLNWFENEPDHLKDVLQGLAAVRQRTVEPEAQKLADILKDYPQLKKQIDCNVVTFKNISKKLNKCDNIYKYFCEDHEPEPSHIFKRSVPQEYVCITLPDLDKLITTELKENFDGFLNKMKGNLHNMNQTFTETIKNIKEELNDKALKHFGRTMYDVLNLQKEYHSFVQEINSTEANILMYAAKQEVFEIGSKLLELEKLVEKYWDYCKTCNKGPVKRSVRQTKLLINENENSKNSIVHEVIQKKYNDSENVLNEIIEKTFKDLNELINDPKKRETYLNNLKLKEKEIIEVANKERLDLEHLKSVASLETIKQLSDTESVSKDMLKHIDEEITRLKKIIK